MPARGPKTPASAPAKLLPAAPAATLAPTPALAAPESGPSAVNVTKTSDKAEAARMKEQDFREQVELTEKEVTRIQMAKKKFSDELKTRRAT